MNGVSPPVVRDASRRNWVIGTVVGAIVFRIALFLSGIVDVVFVTSDSPEYRGLAASLLEHRVFGLDGVPKMNRTPGYPAFLATIFATLGRSQIAVTSAQVFLDALVCAMVVDLAIRAKLGRVGVAAAAATACTCVYTSVYSYEMMTETLYTFGLTASIWVLPDGGVTRLLCRAERKRLVACGLLLGATTLVRPAHAIVLPAFGALALPFLVHRLRRRAVSMRVLGAVLTTVLTVGAAMAAVVVPWMIRNRVVFHAEYEKPDHSHVTLLGFKTDVPMYRHWYTAPFRQFHESYEEPFIMVKPDGAPEVARYVYKGEEADVRAAFDDLSRQIQSGDQPIEKATLERFRTIANARYRAAPRLYVTAPISKLLKFWIAPRLSVLTETKHGGMVGAGVVASLTALNCLYVLPGMLGLLLGTRSGKATWVCAAATVASESVLNSVFFTPQSRYAIPFFPLLCLGIGALVCEIARRWRGRLAAVGSRESRQ